MNTTTTGGENPVVRVQIIVDAAGEFRWRAIAGNGRIIAVTGEGYVSEDWAFNMANRIFPGVPIERVAAA